MEKDGPRNVGIKRLIKNAKKTFRTTENVSYYSKKDYREAEKKYIKTCVLGGRC
ncbi:MAG: hypothetical protein U9Q05_07365 [Thermodesulfobacteriota bacterium]|nr:hypothetical protein [Thermodesulfobacteriota bacterium]